MVTYRRSTLLLFCSLFYTMLVYSISFGEENFSIKREIFLPQKFFVGDTVELRIELKLQERVRVEVPRSIPETDWLKIVKVKIEKASNNDVTVRIFFISYQPGTQVLPVIRLGDITLSNLQIYTSSVLEIRKVKYPRGIKDQLTFPGTYRVIVIFTFLVFSLPFILVFGFVKIKSLVLRIRENILKRIPLLEYRRGLLSLEKDISKFEKRIFYMKLTRLLKRYLSSRIGKNIESLTTKELTEKIEESGLDDAVVKKLMDFFKFSDKVKFQGYKPVLDDMKTHILVMKELVEDIEGIDV